MISIEQLIKAKIPCPETGIEVKNTLCDICSPSSHCGVSAYIKDGVVIKVEGNKDHPFNKGLLCTKGSANRQYLYREDRIKTPLKRVGPKGSNEFVSITWEEAYDTIVKKMNLYKKDFGAESVFFFAGYSKWFRPFLQRFAYSFGSPNYGTESSSCFTSRLMAWKTAIGQLAGPDMKNTKLFIGWAHNPFFTNHLGGKSTIALKERGVKVIIIDTMYTQTAAKYADLFLQPRPGTDGALALTIANILISNDWIDKEYIEKYVHGFEEYAKYCQGFNKSNVEVLTGVPYHLVEQAAKMIYENGPITIKESSAPLAHHINGMQNYRAIMALTAITGSFDRKGGQIPSDFTYVHQSSGYYTNEHHFFEEVKNPNMPLPVGGEKFPLWNHLEGEAQTMDLARHIIEGKPYPIKAMLAFGMNFRMFPQSQKMQEALEKLDFFVDVDLFMTDSSRYADIILPACTSFEREEFKSYPGGYAYYTAPVIEPLYNSKPDSTIICELANLLNLDDNLLKSGYRNCLEYILEPISYSVDELQKAATPLKVPEFKPHEEMKALNNKLSSPTGKFELYSELIAANPQWGLNPLPTYVAPISPEEEKDYPFILTHGGRLPHALHTRLHDVAWLRSLRPQAMADINIKDAASLGIKQDDIIELSSKVGTITVCVNLSAHIPTNLVSLYHGYREANFNDLTHQDRLDPYTGFPAFRSTPCVITKREGTTND